MHFFLSLWWLFLAILLTLVYILVPTAIYLGFKRFKDMFKAGDDAEFPPFYEYFIGKKARFVVIVVISFHVFMYGGEIQHCFRDDANRDARFYYASGKGLNVQRTILTQFLHPENSLLWAFTTLQEKIYATGSQYLPEDDGEIGMWLYEWFLYPYSSQLRKISGVYGGQVFNNPRMVNLLNNFWFVISTVSSKPFKDKAVEREFLQAYPGMVFYWAVFNVYEAPNTGDRWAVYTNKKNTERARQLIGWIETIRQRWQQSPAIQARLHENPKLGLCFEYAYWDAARIMLVSSIRHGEFSCANPYIAKIIQNQQRIENTKIVGKEMERIYLKIRSSTSFLFEKYILKTYCGLDVPGKPDTSDYDYAKIGQDAEAELMMKQYLSLEFSILEEQFGDD